MANTPEEIQKDWKSNERWKGILRPYSAKDVVRLRGHIQIEYTLARLGAEKFWKLLHSEKYIPALGAVTGNQALEQIQSGLKAIYCSGWQVAADANEAGQMYPDQSLYPANSVPLLVRRINNAFMRATQIQSVKGEKGVDWFMPIVADAEAGFGGVLNVFELMREMIEAGAAAVHLEDQLSSAKKCGHMGGKVAVPTSEFIQKLIAARLAADMLGVPTLIVARTDALSAKLITSDHDDRDKPFIKKKERTTEGFYNFEGGLGAVIARGLAYAPYADLLWFETSEPKIAEAEAFAKAIHGKFPGKLLAYNCSPSFNWRAKLEEKAIASFQADLGKMGYKFQFVTLAGFHSLNHSMFQLAKSYREKGMSAFAEFQGTEFASESSGYHAVKHQEFVGTGYFDEVSMVISSGTSSTTAMEGSTEKEQFGK